MKDLRTFLSILGIAAALVMCGVSGAMNYLFLSSLGKTPLEGQALGAASAAADLLKTLLPFFIAWAWRANRMVAATSGSLAFTFFAAFSFLSAIGFAADNRGALIDTRETLAATYKGEQADLAALETRLSSLGAHRPPAVVTEEIEAHKQNRHWAATRGCRDATKVESRAYCERHFQLRAELAASTEAARLSTMIAARKKEALRLRGEGAEQDRDPQVALLSRIFGLAQEPVRLALIIAVALLVEIGSSLGLFLATGHGGFSRKPQCTTAENVAPPVEDKPQPIGSIEDFCLEALVKAEGRTVGENALFSAYQAWCLRRSFTPLDAAAFASAFASLAQAIGLTRINGRVRGVALAVKQPERREAA